MVDIGSMTLSELEEYIVSAGESRFRAKQIYGWLVKGVDFDGMSNISKTLREKLVAECYSGIPKIEQKLVSKVDGTVKYLFSFPDGECVESVVMFYKHGTTICISSQVGCRMGCKFCASTIGGKVRDLTASEILQQLYHTEKDIGERVSNIVMMGIGEPLDNFDNAIAFIRIISSPQGKNISQRNISLSTCGIVPKIYELAQLKLGITLSISLHATTTEKRKVTMPITNAYSVE
ncbi:MAG: radical SAM protein, partial [Clostridia bacterium]|nr:radical SAM protein [Clostridia bacterium]